MTTYHLREFPLFRVQLQSEMCGLSSDGCSLCCRGIHKVSVLSECSGMLIRDVSHCGLSLRGQGQLSPLLTVLKS